MGKPGRSDAARFLGLAQQAHAGAKFMREQLLEYYAPKNFNVWYFFGSLALVVLVMQLFREYS